jgi:hypothetical protein
MRPVSRRALLGAAAAAAVLEVLPAGAQSPSRPLLLDDASRLNAVPIARHWRPGSMTGELAAWHSIGATVVFFRVFGTLYCLDGLLGLATGSGYLDLGIVLHGRLDLPCGRVC